MPQVALSSDFLKAFAQIPRNKQKVVREALEKFKRDPTTAAQNYEKIHTLDDKVRTIRCGIDYRAVVIHPPQGDVHLFVWVDHHDEAMDWARKKRFEVNKHTGTLQVYEVLDGGGVPTDAATELGERPSAPVETVEAERVPPGRLFAGHDNATLLLFGVPEPLLIAVRALREEADLDGLVPYLPEEAADALYLLAAGYSPDETIDELDRAKPAQRVDKAEFDPDDFAAALERPGTQQRFTVVADDHELAEILNAPLAQWRVFLHPSQRKLVEMKSTGAARVLGGAGTGKTVVAMHRARHLAKSCPPDKKVLFTTFTRNLAADIQAQLTTLCRDEGARIEVVNLHAWAAALLQSRGSKVRTPTREQQLAAWAEAMSHDPQETFRESFYRSEWNDVVQAQGILEEAAYLRARRAGRGTRLSRQQRKLVWEVLSAYRRALQRRGFMEPADVIREARLLIESGKVPLRYVAVVADEVQDFSEADLRLLRALVPEGPGDLFLVGDAHQRIYGRGSSLSRCGINVRGLRSRRLRLNYRTTQNIRNWAVSVLRGVSVDDLDEGTDDALRGYHSLRSGEPPRIEPQRTERDEAALILAQLEHWSKVQGRPLAELCLVARTNALLRNRYAPLIENAGYPVQHVQTDESTLGDGVRLATMHRVKGLEFPCVLVAGVHRGTVPLELRDYPDDAARQAHLEQEKRLLFVAATRARDELLVTGFGDPSPLITGDDL